MSAPTRLLAAAIALALWMAPVCCAREAAAKLTGKERKEAEQIAKDYFTATDDAARQSCLERLAAIDHPSDRDVKSLAQKCLVWMRVGPTVEAKSTEKCTHPDYPGEYLVTVPSKARKGKPVGVFISLHGGGEGVGSGAQIQGTFGQPGRGLINVYPTVIQKTDTAWNTEREERYVLEILEDLKRTFNIDTNRVYMAGHSMGGFGTWSIGAKHADRFAAISPQAGGVFWDGNRLASGTVFNLKNLPVWFYHSTDDPRVSARTDQLAAEALSGLSEEYGPYEHVWKEYSDIGHGTPKEGLQPIWDWMLERERDPLPERVLWEPVRSWKTRFYWVGMERPHGRIDVRRDGNTFTVTGEHDGLRIFLNERMVDLEEPVVVRTDGGDTLHDAIVPASLVVMLDSIGSARDPHLVFHAVIDL